MNLKIHKNKLCCLFIILNIILEIELLITALNMIVMIEMIVGMTLSLISELICHCCQVLFL